uniref:C-type lectin domain-containing protein n=1 Tax=Setaria digitata TaxID=48799 RepID=A0A915PD28_9BILA
MWWYAIHLVFMLFTPIYLTFSSGGSDSNNTSSLTVADLIGLEEFSGNLTELCLINSSKNCTDVAVNRNFNKTLNNDKLTNKSDSIEITTHSTTFGFGNSNALSSASDANLNLTNMDQFVVAGSENFTFAVSVQTEINNLLSMQSLPLENATQNDTLESDKSDVITTEARRKLDFETESNKFSVNLNNITCLNYLEAINGMKSADEMLPVRNTENVVFISDRSSLRSDLQKLLEIIRDATDVLLQTLRMTVSGDTATNKALAEITNSTFLDNINLCMEKWSYFAKTNSCYFVSENSTSYYDASSTCSTNGAFLTSVTDYDEMEFISTLVKNDSYLIGLFKDDNSWRWIDNNTEFNYTKWRPEQPNNCCGTNVNCVVVNFNGIFDNKWDDVDCNIISAKFISKLSMTVPYHFELASLSSLAILRVLFRWKGSVWKLIYKELIFGNLAYYFDTRLEYIPTTFILGFFVDTILSRWTHIFVNMGYIESYALLITNYIHGKDEKAKWLRQTLIRYLYLTQVFVFRDISIRVRKRFPTIDSMVDAGILLEEEKEKLNSIKLQYNKYWAPIRWIYRIALEARNEETISSDLIHWKLCNEIDKFRYSLQLLCNYEWVPIPLVYSQVVFLAVYVHFFVCLISRQFIVSNNAMLSDIDLVVPVMTMIQFVFFIGWLKVAQALLNPFGDDDDDFECNYLIDKNIAISLCIVDNYDCVPEVRPDIFWHKCTINNKLESKSVRLKKRTLSISNELRNVVDMANVTNMDVIPSDYQLEIIELAKNGTFQTNNFALSNLTANDNENNEVKITRL